MVKIGQLVTGSEKLGRAEAQDHSARGTVLMSEVLECLASCTRFEGMIRKEGRKREVYSTPLMCSTFNLL